MNFNGQLNILVTASAALVAFVGCVFSGALTVASSFCIAAGVFLAGFLFGRRLTEIVFDRFR